MTISRSAPYFCRASAMCWAYSSADLVIVDRAGADDDQQAVVLQIQDGLGALARVFDEGGFKLSEPELVHEQGGLDETEGFQRREGRQWDAKDSR
jgi:hypothetical protein